MVNDNYSSFTRRALGGAKDINRDQDPRAAPRSSPGLPIGQVFDMDIGNTAACICMRMPPWEIGWPGLTLRQFPSRVARWDEGLTKLSVGVKRLQRCD